MQKYVLKVEFSLHKIAFCEGYAYKITIYKGDFGINLRPIKTAI
jgi:hypothetical protein